MRDIISTISTVRLIKEQVMTINLYDRAGCPLCGSSNLSDFMSLDSVPVLVGALWPTQEAAKRALVGNIKLTYCRDCSFIHNRAFEPTKLVYAPGYEISLHHSPLY